MVRKAFHASLGVSSLAYRRDNANARIVQAVRHRRLALRASGLLIVVRIRNANAHVLFRANAHAVIQLQRYTRCQGLLLRLHCFNVFPNSNLHLFPIYLSCYVRLLLRKDRFKCFLHRRAAGRHLSQILGEANLLFLVLGAVFRHFPREDCRLLVRTGFFRLNCVVNVRSVLILDLLPLFRPRRSGSYTNGNKRFEVLSRGGGGLGSLVYLISSKLHRGPTHDSLRDIVAIHRSFPSHFVARGNHPTRRKKILIVDSKGILQGNPTRRRIRF